MFLIVHQEKYRSVQSAEILRKDPLLAPFSPTEQKQNNAAASLEQTESVLLLRKKNDGYDLGSQNAGFFDLISSSEASPSAEPP